MGDGWGDMEFMVVYGLANWLYTFQYTSCKGL